MPIFRDPLTRLIDYQEQRGLISHATAKRARRKARRDLFLHAAFFSVCILLAWVLGAFAFLPAELLPPWQAQEECTTADTDWCICELNKLTPEQCANILD